jgi:hypothetical protein
LLRAFFDQYIRRDAGAMHPVTDIQGVRLEVFEKP